MNFQPLDQFEIVFLGYLGNIPINNSFLYMIFLYLIIRFFFGIVFINRKLIPYNWQSAIESFYNFAFNLVKDQIGVKGYPYFPFVFSLFLFIITANFLGMTLYSFTITSHITVTFTFSLAIFIGVVIIGIMVQKVEFINTFIPSGAPAALLPFLIVIEIISYISRPFSLAIRLFANMMAGHSLLAILAGFTFAISKKNMIIALIPFVIIVALVGLEAMIAGLQAYVFAVLVCIYINDSLEGAH